MAEILEKLSFLQGTQGGTNTRGMAGNTGVSTGSLDNPPVVVGDARVAELEKQLGDLTYRRLDYLEKMHEQQIHVQVGVSMHFL